jgi:hypothetical protein
MVLALVGCTQAVTEEKGVAMSLAVLETRVDEKKLNVLHVTLINDGDLPQALWISSSWSVSKRTDGNYYYDPSAVGRFRVFMVTRRSIANPDEQVKLRFELELPAKQYSARSGFRLCFSEGHTCSEVVIPLQATNNL